MKNIKLIVIFLSITFAAFAQAPQGFSYQAIVRNTSNALVTNTAVGMRISILQTTATGTAVYVETQTPTTNANGLVTVSIGSGTVVSGTFNAIDWNAGPYFIKTETDPTGGTTYTITGTSQMMSVPYALYAAKAGSASAAGADKQITFNNAGVSSGNASLTWNNTTSTLSTTNAAVTALGGLGTRNVQVDNNGNLTAVAVPTAGVTGTGNTNYHVKWTTGGSVLGNSLIQDNGSTLSINYPVQANSQFYVYRQQQTATGDGQSTVMGYRDRNTQNVGANYGQLGSNTGVTGHSFWGDDYSFGVGGWNYNDFVRTGGTIGGEIYGSYWGALGYKSSSSTSYGVYGSNAYSNGAGKSANAMAQGVGGGFFGMIGSMSKGDAVGQINSGELFSSYNSGNVYTLGKNVELVANADNTKTAVYAVSSTESTIYTKGKAQLVNGEVYIAFNENYKRLLGEEPEVTITPKGNCNGVYIASIDKNGFTVKELNNGTSNVAISWISVGNRIDNKVDEATRMVSTPDFDQNIQGVLFNDGADLTGKGKGIWYDGSKLQFGTMPESLSKVIRPEQDTKK